jgi:hypothetical protein
LKRVLCFFILLLSHTPTLYALSYSESSSGLVPPTMDGGRTEIEMADINQDGNLDLLSIGDHGSPYINTDQHGIMVWFGDGTGSWSVYMNGNFGYGGISVGDVNNDGFLDVGYGMHHNYSGNDLGDQLIEVALGDGTGQNWQPWDDSLAQEGQSWGMFCTDFSDFNNDGFLDIVSNAFGYGDGVHAYINNTDGSWHYTYGFLGGNSDMDIDCGDVNNDGNADFAVSHQGGTVYIGDGSGSFLSGHGNLPPGGSLGLGGVALGDVNNDGGDEISFCNSNGGIEVWTWIDVNTWNNISGTLPASGSYDLTQLFDMDVDGNLDVVGFGSGEVMVWRGDGSGNWTFETSFTTPSPGDAEALRTGGDADHNGFPDIVLVSREGSWPSDYNHVRFFKETSQPGTLSISPLYPHGGEKFIAGSVHFIDWISAVPDTSRCCVHLELSTTGSSGPWETVVDSTPDNGRYQWHINDTLSSTDCHIRYRLCSSTDTAVCITPAPFEIINPSAIEEHPTPHSPLHPRIEISPTLSMSGPFSLTYSLGDQTHFTIAIYDCMGRKVRTLCEEQFGGKQRTLSWDGRDSSGKEVVSGVYYIILDTGRESSTKKVIILR